MQKKLLRASTIAATVFAVFAILAPYAYAVVPEKYEGAGFEAYGECWMWVKGYGKVYGEADLYTPYEGIVWLDVWDGEQMWLVDLEIVSEFYREKFDTYVIKCAEVTTGKQVWIFIDLCDGEVWTVGAGISFYGMAYDFWFFNG